MSNTSLEMIKGTRQAEAYHFALRLLNRMILTDPTNAMAFWQKGEVYEAMAMHDIALRFYSVAHEMCPRAYSYQELLGAYDRLKENLTVKSPPKMRRVR